MYNINLQSSLDALDINYLKENKTYIIKTIYGYNISGSAEDKILAIKTIRNTCYRLKSKFKRKFIDSYIFTKLIGKGHYRVIEGIGPELIQLGKIEKGDYIIIPIKKEIKDRKYILLSEYTTNYYLKNDLIKCTNFYHTIREYSKLIKEYNLKPIKGRMTQLSKKYKIPISTIYQWIKKNQKTRTDIHTFSNKIIIDNNFMRLLGYYLAEGAGVSDHQIRFTFNKVEQEYINDVKVLLMKVFRIKNNKDVPNINALNVAASSRLLKEFFRNMVGNEAIDKKLPEWILYLPHEKQKELLNGYWRGDGCKSGYGFQFDTSSRILANQVRLILQRLGFMPTFRKVIKDLKGTNRKNPKYVVELFGEKVKDFCDIVDEDHSIMKKRSKTYNNGWNDGNYVFLPIRKIEQLGVKDV